MTIGLILIDPGAADPYVWSVGEGAQLHGAGRGAAVVDLPKALLDAERLIVILPGEMAATRQLMLPVRGDKALDGAARLAFEDVLSCPADQFHFAFGPINEDGHRLVTAFPAEALASLIHEFESHGLAPDEILVDHGVLSGADADKAVLVWGERLLSALPDGAFTGEAAGLAPLLDNFGWTDDALRVAAHRPELKADVHLADDRALASFFYGAVAGHTSANLRSGIFAKRRDWGSLAGMWRHAAALMAACFVLWIVQVGIDAAKHGRATDEAYAEAETAFRQAFPETPVRDLRRQAQQRLGTGGRSDFLPLSADLAAALEASVAVELRGVRFTRENLLVADLRVPDTAALDQLKVSLRERGLIVREEGSLRRDDDGNYSGQLLLEAS